MGATSSANPYRLRQYSIDGLAMTTKLRATAGTLSGALERLRSFVWSPYLPGIGRPDVTLADLAGDWYHLDEFVGDVANGFFAADDGSPLGANVHQWAPTVADEVIASGGRVGYADRDRAVADAERLAGDIDDARTLEEVEALADRARRGQYDPAFAVTLSEALGVQGYVDLVAKIRSAAPLRPDQGLPIISVFSTVLTTALDTDMRIPCNGNRDPENAWLPPDERIDQGFVDALAFDWQPDTYMGYGDAAQLINLSVLMSMADPPTFVAVDVATNRATPYLRGRSTYEPADPGEALTNYATMLARNPDASVQWLTTKLPDNTFVIDHVLRRSKWDNVDGGVALATVAESALTGSDAELRKLALERTIEIIGGDLHDIRNPHLVPVLAEAAQANFETIIHQAVGLHLDGSGAAHILNTYDFFKVLMADTDAAAGIYSETLTYAQQRLAAATVPDAMRAAAHDIGKVFALVSEADIDADIERAQERAARRAAIVDSLTRITDVLMGLSEGEGLLSDAGWGIDVLADKFRNTGDVEKAYHNASVIVAATQDQLTALCAAAEYAHGGWTSDQVLAATRRAVAVQGDGLADLDFFVDGTSGPNRPIKPLSQMSESERTAFELWAGSGDVIGRTGDIRTQIGQSGDEITDVIDAGR